VTHLAAANEYKVEHLKQPHIWSLVEKAQYYYVGGYHLTVCVPAILALAEEAAAKNKVCSMIRLIRVCCRNIHMSNARPV
jgi:adenosine kinase